MTDAPKPSDEKQPDGTVTPTPTGGTPATPTPAATKPAPIPGDRQQGTPPPAVKPTPGTPATPATPAAVPGASPTPGVKQEPTQVPITALHEERTKRQALEQEMSLLRQQQAAVSPQAPVQQPQQEQAQALRKEIDALWDEDPKKAVQAEIMVALDWRDRVDASMDVEADNLGNKYSDFGKYRSAAQGYIRGLPLEQRSKPGIMELAYFVVRGQNVDTLMEDQRTNLIQQYQNGELAASLTQAPAGTVTPAPITGVVLTEDQSKAAAMMGLSPEDYMSAMPPAPVGV